MSLLENLPHTADHKRRTRQRSGNLGYRDSFSDVATGLSCWIQPASDSDIVEFNKRGITITAYVYFTDDPGIIEEDVLVIDGMTYEVKSDARPDTTSGLGVLFRALVEETSTGSTPT